MAGRAAGRGASQPLDGSRLQPRRRQAGGAASNEVIDIAGGELNMVLGRIRNDEIAAGCDVVAVETDDDGNVYEVVLTTGVRRRLSSPDAALSDLYAQAGARRTSRVRLRV